MTILFLQRYLGVFAFSTLGTLGNLILKLLNVSFIGYSPTQEGHKCYHPPSRRSFVSMDVTFRESKPYFSITPSPLQAENYKEEEMIFPSSSVESEIGEKIKRETVGRLERPDLITYSRRNKAERAIMQSAEAESSFSGELSTFPNELDLSITYKTSQILHQTPFI